MQRSLIAVVFLGIFLGINQNILAETWRAGSASARITPDEFMWMAGYASRDRPADGKVTELYSKALVLESANNTRAVIITLDLVGIDRELSNEVRDLIETRFSIPAAHVVLCCSHTHSGPVVKRNLGPLHYY
ncbi:MAG: neutral/alkaline non-lysosomal ceramidase N-terminal domain-containing protein [Pirellula sp.]|nr:neutral/alkaline non-lysosomal ceramidase N-terminal domain-containing protein [Pirellula sp.]